MEAGLYVLKGLSNLSFIFIIVNFVFGLISRIPPWHLLLFLGVNLLSFLVYYLKRRDQQELYGILFLFAAAPLIFLPLADIFYVLVTYVLAVYLGLRGIRLKKDYGFMTDLFSKGLVVIVFVAFFLLLLSGPDFTEKNFSVYILIFFFASILLLRTLRHLRYNDDQQALRKINLSYAVLVISGSLVLGSSTVRGFLWAALTSIYDRLVWLVAYIFSWVVTPIAYLFDWLVNGLLRLDLSGYSGRSSSSENLVQNTEGMDQISLDILYQVAGILADVLLVLLLFYGLYRILRPRNDSERETEEYIESREAILPLGGKTFRLPKILDFAPRNGSEAIRYYYKQFLHLGLKREINIRHSDTTKEIERKSEPEFDREALQAMRATYIGVRYGEEACGNETVKHYRSLFKRMVQGSRRASGSRKKGR